MFSSIIRHFTQARAKSLGIALQPPGEAFDLPRATKLTALEELVIAVPIAILGPNEAIGSVVHSDPNAEIYIPKKPTESMIFLRLKKGMSVSLTKSCQALLIADDRRPRRIKVESQSN